MYKLNCFKFLLFTILISRTNCVIKFNNLKEKLVLQLLKVKPRTNLVASSIFVRFPLCKLGSVATGDAKQELMTVLGFKDDNTMSNCYMRLKESIKTMSETDLTQVNKIYVNYTDDIDPNFITNSTERYGVQVEKVGFNYPKAAVAYINRWIGAGTYKRIIDVLDVKDVNKETRMVIVNAIHFKGTWEFPFDFRLTKLMKFIHIDGKSSRVPMMTRTDQFAFVTAGEYKLLTVKFASWRATMTFVVPGTAQGLPDLLQKLEAEPNFIGNVVKKMPSVPLRVYIPRFKIKTYVDWSGFLQELGLYEIFSETSTGLSAILKESTTKKSFPLSKVKQKLFIQIDELGVARFTHDPIRHLGPPKVPQFFDVPEFAIDKPFYFQVTLDFENARHELFTGVYYGPEPAVIPTKV